MAHNFARQKICESLGVLKKSDNLRIVIFKIKKD